MTVRAPDAERVNAVVVTNENRQGFTTAQPASAVLVFPRFLAGDVDLCYTLALWSELVGDQRRAAELRDIGTRIARDLYNGGGQSFKLLDMGRVGSAGKRASEDVDSCITSAKVWPVVQRLCRAAIGEVFDIVRIVPAGEC